MSQPKTNTMYQVKHVALGGLDGTSDRTVKMPFKLHNGYVRETNNLLERVAKIVEHNKVAGFVQKKSPSTCSGHQIFAPEKFGERGELNNFYKYLIYFRYCILKNIVAPMIDPAPSALISAVELQILGFDVFSLGLLFYRQIASGYFTSPLASVALRASSPLP